MRYELNMLDLLLGKKISVPTIEGRRREAEIPPGFNLKDYLRIPHEGMPHFGSGRSMFAANRGDLLVDFIIKAPRPDGKIKKALES